MIQMAENGGNDELPKDNPQYFGQEKEEGIDHAK